MKTAIVYYSYTGNNEVLANELQHRLECKIGRVTEKKKRNGLTIFLDMLFHRKPAVNLPDLQLKDFEQVIFLAPVWMGKIASPLRSFLEQERDHVHSYSFITLSGSKGNSKITEELSNLLGKRPEAVMELAVNDLLPEEKKDKVRYTSGYRAQPDDMKVLADRIERFCMNVGATHAG